MPQTGPTLWKTKWLCPRTEWACLEASPVRCSRRRCQSGRTGPSCGEQRTERAWLPAPLVWTWVRAYRQLHAGNAGLRPATTSFPFALLYRIWDRWIERSRQERLRLLPFPFYTFRSNGLRTRRKRALLKLKLSVKKGESCVVDSSTTFPRLSREGQLRNGEDAANLRAFLRLRFAENCADRALYEVPRFCDC